MSTPTGYRCRLLPAFFSLVVRLLLEHCPAFFSHWLSRRCHQSAVALSLYVFSSLTFFSFLSHILLSPLSNRRAGAAISPLSSRSRPFLLSPLSSHFLPTLSSLLSPSLFASSSPRTWERGYSNSENTRRPSCRQVNIGFKAYFFGCVAAAKHMVAQVCWLARNPGSTSSAWFCVRDVRSRDPRTTCRPGWAIRVSRHVELVLRGDARAAEAA